MRRPQRPAVGARRRHHRLMDALEIEKAIIGGCDWGARTVNIIAALWPERCKAMVSVSGYLIGSQAAGRMPLPPQGRAPVVVSILFRHRARPGRLRANTRDFARLIWQTRLAEMAVRRCHVRSQRRRLRQSRTMSPSSSTTTAGGSASPKASRGMTIWRNNLPRRPVITVPTITLEGDANGAPHPDPSAYAGSSRAGTSTG